jgi:hypothetical protein
MHNHNNRRHNTNKINNSDIAIYVIFGLFTVCFLLYCYNHRHVISQTKGEAICCIHGIRYNQLHKFFKRLGNKHTSEPMTQEELNKYGDGFNFDCRFFSDAERDSVEEKATYLQECQTYCFITTII